MNRSDFEARLASISNELSYLADEGILTDESSEIAEMITFENSNEIAYHLMNTAASHEAAAALYEEMQYWMNKRSNNE